MAITDADRLWAALPLITAAEIACFIDLIGKISTMG